MESPLQASFSPFYISPQHWLYLENIAQPIPCRARSLLPSPPIVPSQRWNIGGTPAILHCTVLRYTCNTALYCTEVHLQHLAVLYWGTPALYCTCTVPYISICRVFTLLPDPLRPLERTLPQRLFSTKLYYTVLHCTTLYYTVLHCTTFPVLNSCILMK